MVYWITSVSCLFLSVHAGTFGECSRLTSVIISVSLCEPVAAVGGHACGHLQDGDDGDAHWAAVGPVMASEPQVR